MSESLENNHESSDKNPTGKVTYWTSEKLNSKELLDLIRKEIQAEHNLIANRMTWYVSSQAFLMAAFTITGNNDYNYTWLAKLIPLLGLLNSLIIWLSLQAAVEAMSNCKKFQNYVFNEDDNLTNLKEFKRIFLEPPMSDKSGNYKAKWIHPFGLLPPKLIPLLFLTTWLFISSKVWIEPYHSLLSSSYYLSGLEDSKFLFLLSIIIVILLVIFFKVWKNSQGSK